jgi:hypothetical protein
LIGVWTGGTLSPYLQRLPEYYGPVALRDHGLSASEGRLTIPLEDGMTAGPLNVEAAVYEFVPLAEHGREDPPTVSLYDLEPGARYVIVLTTSGGLVRYDLGDVVECTGRVGSTPLVRFLHKAGHVVSLTGEKLSAFQVTEALRSAQQRVGGGVAELALVPQIGDPAGYVLLVEAGDAASAAGLPDALDRGLCAANMEYADKRRSGRLLPVRLAAVEDGTFSRRRRDRLAARGGAPEQYKHPFLITDLDEAAALLEAVSAPAGRGRSA